MHKLRVGDFVSCCGKIWKVHSMGNTIGLITLKNINSKEIPASMVVSSEQVKYLHTLMKIIRK